MGHQPWAHARGQALPGNFHWDGEVTRVPTDPAGPGQGRMRHRAGAPGTGVCTCLVHRAPAGRGGCSSATWSCSRAGEVPKRGRGESQDSSEDRFALSKGLLGTAPFPRTHEHPTQSSSPATAWPHSQPRAPALLVQAHRPRMDLAALCYCPSAHTQPTVLPGAAGPRPWVHYYGPRWLCLTRGETGPFKSRAGDLQKPNPDQLCPAGHGSQAEPQGHL